MKANSADDAPCRTMQAEFLAGDGENEIGMGVGQDSFQDALARPLAEPAAGNEAVERRVDLERVGDAAVCPGSMNCMMRARTCGTNL